MRSGKRNRKLRYPAILISASLVFCFHGCRDPKSATKENFRRVITEHLSRQPEFLSFEIPNSIRLDDLVQTGLLVKESFPDAVSRNAQYAVAPRSDGLVSKDRDRIMLQVGAIDPGSVQVVRFTEPQSMFGRTGTEVEYTVSWKPTQLLLDKKYSRIGSAFPSLAAFRAPEERKIILILYNDGWTPEGL